MKLNADELLDNDFFNTDTVQVNANELKALIKNKRSLESERDSLLIEFRRVNKNLQLALSTTNELRIEIKNNSLAIPFVKLDERV